MKIFRFFELNGVVREIDILDVSSFHVMAKIQLVLLIKGNGSMLWHLLYQILNMFKFWLNRENVVYLIGAGNDADWSGISLIYEFKVVLYFALEDRKIAAV